MYFDVARLFPLAVAHLHTYSPVLLVGWIRDSITVTTHFQVLIYTHTQLNFFNFWRPAWDQQTLRNTESLSQNNCVGSKSASRKTQAGVARRAEWFTHDEGNKFSAVTRKLHASIRTMRAQSHNRLKKPRPTRNKFSLPCRRPPRIAVLHSCQYSCIGKIVGSLYYIS